ncbi:MAG: preprotein translocase subunit YajC [Bacteroidales bacterium]|nr:preprotein translocase subunit YajC [Bacteroidales bacterium]
MNFLTLLQAAGAANPSQPGQGAMSWIMIILLILVMWLFMIRPQRKQQKEHQKYIESLKKGDKVICASGIYGKIDTVSDTTLLVEIADGVKIKVDKNSVQADPTAAPAPEKK